MGAQLCLEQLHRHTGGLIEIEGGVLEPRCLQVIHIRGTVPQMAPMKGSLQPNRDGHLKKISYRKVKVIICGLSIRVCSPQSPIFA